VPAVHFLVRGVRQHVLGIAFIHDTYFGDEDCAPCRGIVVSYRVLFAIAVAMAVIPWLWTARRHRRPN